MYKDVLQSQVNNQIRQYSNKAVGLMRTLSVKQDTRVSVMEKPRYVAIDDAICFQETINAGSQRSTPSDPVKCSKITLEFSDSSGLSKILIIA